MIGDKWYYLNHKRIGSSNKLSQIVVIASDEHWVRYQKLLAFI